MAETVIVDGTEYKAGSISWHETKGQFQATQKVPYKFYAQRLRQRSKSTLTDAEIQARYAKNPYQEVSISQARAQQVATASGQQVAALKNPSLQRQVGDPQRLKRITDAAKERQGKYYLDPQTGKTFTEPGKGRVRTSQPARFSGMSEAQKQDLQAHARQTAQEHIRAAEVRQYGIRAVQRAERKDISPATAAKELSFMEMEREKAVSMKPQTQDILKRQREAEQKRKIQAQKQDIGTKGLQDIPTYYTGRAVKSIASKAKSKFEAVKDKPILIPAPVPFTPFVVPVRTTPKQVVATAKTSYLSAERYARRVTHKVIPKDTAKFIEGKIEKATQFRISRIKSTDRYKTPTKIGALGKLEYRDVSPTEFRKQTREFGDVSKGFSTGVITSIREKPVKLAAIAGASALATGVIAPAFKFGGLVAFTKSVPYVPATLGRGLLIAGKGVALGTKATLGTAYGVSSIARIKAAETAYAKGKVFGTIGTELGAIYAGGLIGSRLAPGLQRKVIAEKTVAGGAERRDVFELLKKAKPKALKAYKVKVPKKQFQQMSPQVKAALRKGDVLFGARGQRLWMKKDVAWLEPGTIKIGAGKWKGSPRVMKDIDVVLRPFSTLKGAKLRAAKAGLRADPHTYSDWFIRRRIPGVTSRPITLKGGGRVIKPGEQTFRKFLGISSVRDAQFYRAGKDIPDFVAGAESLLGSKAVKGLKAWTPMAKPTTAYGTYFGFKSTPKVTLPTIYKTTPYSYSSVGSTIVFPVTPSFKSRPSRYSYPYSVSTSPYYSISRVSSPSSSLSRPSSISSSPSSSISPSPSSSLSSSPSSSFYSSPSSYYSSSPSSVSSIISYSPSPSTSSLQPPTPIALLPKKKKPKKKVRMRFRVKTKQPRKYTPTLHAVIGRIEVKLPEATKKKLQKTKFTGLSGRPIIK